MYYDTAYKNCYNCSGTGRVETYQYKTRYNSARGVYQSVSQRVSRHCYRCSGRGRVVDQYRTHLNKRQRQNQQRKIKQQKQKQRIAEQKRKQQQELKNKQKRFKQYVRRYQNQLNKPLLEDVEYSSEESQQYESPNQWLIQKVMAFQKQQRIIYCGVCAGTGYQRAYLSKEINTCSNCKGSGKITFNQQNQPQFVLSKPQLKINNEPKTKVDESNEKLIFCGICGGKGYEKVYMSDEIRRCQNCNGIGKLSLNPNDFPKKLKYQSYSNYARKLQQNYKKAKQKKQKKNKKIKNRNKNKNIPPPKKIKSEEQLRKQFQKIQEDQRVEKERKKWLQEYQDRQRMEILRKNLGQKKRKEKQQKDRQWQQFIKTPQGIRQLKKQQRQRKINDCIQKICCGPPSCKRVFQWCTISVTIFITVYVLANYY